MLSHSAVLSKLEIFLQVFFPKLNLVNSIEDIAPFICGWGRYICSACTSKNCYVPSFIRTKCGNFTLFDDCSPNMVQIRKKQYFSLLVSLWQGPCIDEKSCCLFPIFLRPNCTEIARDIHICFVVIDNCNSFAFFFFFWFSFVAYHPFSVMQCNYDILMINNFYVA